MIFFIYQGLKIILETKLEDLKRIKTFNSIMKFLETRVELDLMGWESTDIFAHKIK
jgi:ribonuclease D